MKRRMTAIITQEEDMYIAENPETGIVSQGKTIDEAISNLKEAVELYLEEFPNEKKRNIPFMTFFEVVDHVKTTKATWN
ncbi:MAG: type II toxin-antitoxin system HicB family antitoxin [Candidatus Diapherotrites archaeon]|nr:type II toxin-antitoxin system HicB family antitoxin [Candidatus Diapherotrites archaeon]